MDNLKENISFEGMTENDANEFKTLLTKFVKSYSSKDKNISDCTWLTKEFKTQLPDLSDEQAEKMAVETLDSISEYDENLSDLNRACKTGKNKEQWFADKVAKATAGVSVIDYGNYLNTIDTTMGNANAQMLRTITTKNGEISNCFNLDGYIAEQQHVNQFNMEAVLRKSPLRAEVKVPGPNETYGKNSFDVVITDTSKQGNSIINQYQMKYGKDANSTIQLLKNPDGSCKYNNQRLVVPAEQLEKVQKAFPEKTVTSYIGNNEKINFGSKGLTKQNVKDLQLDTQNKNCLPRTDWNSFETKQLALNIGKQASFAGLGAAALTTGFSLAEQIIRGDGIDTDATVELALKTGVDAGVKAATAGALKVGAEKGILSIIPKGTPAGTIANIVCVTIENVKILAKVANGEITMSQALEQMGRTTISMVYGLGWGANGMVIGAAALSWIPIVGPLVGGLAGGMIGYMAGSKFGSAVFSGVKALGKGVENVMKSVRRGIKTVGGKISSFIKSHF